MLIRASSCARLLNPGRATRLVVRRHVLLLVTADFERLATLDRVHVDLLARTALQAQDNLLRRLRLLVEHRLGLATVPRLLGVVTTLPCVRCANRASSRQSRVSTRRIRFTRASSRASHPRHRSSARAIARVDRHRRRVFAPRTLRVQARLARLVLRHLVRGVLLAPLAERLLRFRHLFAFARVGCVVAVSHRVASAIAREP